MLYFGEEQLFWKCHADIRSEDKYDDDEVNFDHDYDRPGHSSLFWEVTRERDAFWSVFDALETT